MLNKKYKRVLQLELNEISRPVIDVLIAQHKLPNFSHIDQHWTYCETTSELEYQHLEPWIQWITAHTGKTFAEHQVFRLSDCAKLTYPQIWEVLSEQGVESGIIGSMNAVRGQAEGGIFFPDPWAKPDEVSVHPQSLQPLWDLISRRVQQHATDKIPMADLLKAFKTCLGLGLPFNLYVKIAKQLVAQRIDPLNKWKLPAVFDVFLAEIFKQTLKKTDFGFYTLFLNAIAHYQHHYWRNFDKQPFSADISYPDCHPADDPMTHGYQAYDKILKFFIEEARRDDTLVMIVSGLSQVPYVEKDGEGGMHYYRLKDHQAFADMLGLGHAKAFPMMSRDWQLKFDTENQLNFAKTILSGLRVDGEQLFKVDQNAADTLFIETAVTKGDLDSQFICDGDKKIAVFSDVFCSVAIKSGHHAGKGVFWMSEAPSSSNQLVSPAKIALADVFSISQQALGTK